MSKIVLLEHILAHYQKDVFEKLLELDKFDFRIVSGDDYKGIKSLEGDQYVIFKYSDFKIRKHEFYYLHGSFRYILNERPDAIICTGLDLHLIHTILIFLLQRFILRKKFFWWSHATFGNQGRFGALLRSFFYKYSNGILSYSLKGKENLKLMGVNNSRVHVVNNSLNREDYGYLNNNIFVTRPDRVFTVLFCGRITESKKINILIEALGILYNQHNFEFKCVIIGDGETEGLKKLTQVYDIYRYVEFPGSKYGHETYPYFLNSDLFVYPGGIGLSLVQALSFGLPVITTDNVALHGPEIELLRPGLNGDFYSDNSSNALATKIIEWKNRQFLANDEIKRVCVQTIMDFGYLPEIVTSRVEVFLNAEFETLKSDSE